MEPLTEKELDTSFAQGFLETWVGFQKPEVKKQLEENLKVLVDAIAAYHEDYNNTLEKHNQLIALSAQYLAIIQQQREQIDQLLIESQRDLHHTEE